MAEIPKDEPIPPWAHQKEGEPPPSSAGISVREVGTFRIVLKESGSGGCRIKLQENIEGAKRPKTIGIWASDKKSECREKIKQISLVAQSIRARRYIRIQEIEKNLRKK